MSLLIDSIATLLLLIGIVVACSVFTNAIEWLGHRFKLSEGAVGSVLAAVGTALPETLVPTVALIQAAVFQASGNIDATALSEETAHIGVGAILGAPFMLTTLGFFIVGASTIFFAAKHKRGKVLHLDLHLFKRDMNYFFIGYILVFAASQLHLPQIKWGIAAGLVLLYALYVKRTLDIEHIPDEEFNLEPLTFAPKSTEPPTWIIVFQTFAGLAGILLMAHLFVGEMRKLASLCGISTLVLSLIIAPIATELPEKFNSIMWIGRKKDNLALGNMTGAMVFQSCIPGAIGILFTPWVLDNQGLLSMLLALGASGLVYLSVVWRRVLTPNVLVLAGAFYLCFLAYSIYVVMHPVTSGTH